MKGPWQALIVSVPFLAVSHGALADSTLKAVMLSDLWRPSTTSLVIQVNKQSLLVMNNRSDGKPYELSKGLRLIIRAAHVQLKDDVTIQGPTGDPIPGQETAPVVADPGTAGKAGDPGNGGGRGGNGADGKNGNAGAKGLPGSSIILEIGDIQGSGSLLVADQGGKGAKGQDGQGGGKGGQAGHGGKAKSSVGCDKSGGDAGPPGLGGTGGLGGRGGDGGTGGTLKVSPAVAAVAELDGNVAPTTKASSGHIAIYYGGGQGGDPGSGGKGGPGGEGNDGGEGDGFCNGGHGVSKASDTPDTIGNLGAGNNGAVGQVVDLSH